MDGPYHALRLPAVTHRAARGFDTGGEGFLPHALVGPHVLQELVAGDDPVTVLNEGRQHLEHFGATGDAHPLSMQFIPLRIEGTIAKDIRHSR